VWEDFNQAFTNVVNNENKSEMLIMPWQLNKYNIKKKTEKQGRSFKKKELS